MHTVVIGETDREIVVPEANLRGWDKTSNASDINDFDIYAGAVQFSRSSALPAR